ncbi:MAG: hypothetical protein LJE84_08470 [Gammaproteobacteria bacterium]|nr:hypothetical protein [Gammaproteobacteria bacterium]
MALSTARAARKELPGQLLLLCLGLGWLPWALILDTRLLDAASTGQELPLALVGALGICAAAGSALLLARLLPWRHRARLVLSLPLAGMLLAGLWLAPEWLAREAAARSTPLQRASAHKLSLALAQLGDAPFVFAGSHFERLPAATTDVRAFLAVSGAAVYFRQDPLAMVQPLNPGDTDRDRQCPAGRVSGGRFSCPLSWLGILDWIGPSAGQPEWSAPEIGDWVAQTALPSPDLDRRLGYPAAPGEITTRYAAGGDLADDGRARVAASLAPAAWTGLLLAMVGLNGLALLYGLLRLAGGRWLRRASTVLQTAILGLALPFLWPSAVPYSETFGSLLAGVAPPVKLLVSWIIHAQVLAYPTGKWLLNLWG